MEFIELKPFTNAVDHIISDDEYSALQWHIFNHPESGTVIKGTGGARKLRWGSENENKGKQGGCRTIYFYHKSENEVWMLAIYPKSEKDNITEKHKKVLKKLIDEIK